MELSDEDLARLIQEQEYETITGSSTPRENEESLSPHVFTGEGSIDDSGLDLDTEAPFKDLHGLFLAFNDQYFDSKLSACEVRWSPRMTRCAGLCYYQSKAQYCSIRLSEPLLKFRPESDYIDTLLHEMIHAYLFVTKTIQDHDGHGTDFQYHMNRINKAAGTSITIYHTFHDEVRHYLTHIWKCNGPCQQRPPYYGVVKRSMNRPPQPADRWYAEHQQTCGGTYTKISEPESSKKKAPSKTQKGTKSDPESKGRILIDNYFPVSKKTEEETEEVTSSSSSSKKTSASDGVKEEWLLTKVGDNTGSAKEKNRKATGGSNVFDNTQDPTVRLLSPREAAAAAALQRLERHLSSINPASPTPRSSGKEDFATSILVNEGSSRKRIKTEQINLVGLAKKDVEAAPPRIKAEIQSRSAPPSVKVENFGDRTALTPSSWPISTNPSLNTTATVPALSATMMVTCPVCSKQVVEASINDHVDLCIWSTNGSID
ncbi:hypothetical protein EDD11_006414 [Mortierella claussenii]|nr:hypothetical protein EDD11_006414 [Mortierella claussenii]